MSISISKQLTISKNSRTLIIAEISANHCGSKSNFLKHIIEAKKNGADLVKIQTYEPQDMVINKKYVIRKGLWKKKNLWNLYKQAQTPFKWHYDAFKLAKKNKIELFSTPFSVRALNFLKKFNPNIYKISSFEITDLNLINEIAKKRKPIIISTGLSEINEILTALKVIKKYHNNIIILYCVSGYPTPLKEINFEKIKKIKDETGVKFIGFSDHTQGIDASILSLSHDVKIIEKHFTLNKYSKSPDAKFSISPNELRDLKRMTVSYDLINRKKKVLGQIPKPSQIFRRSIYAVKDIKKNEIFNQKILDALDQKMVLVLTIFLKLLEKSKVYIKKNTALLKKNFIKF